MRRVIGSVVVVLILGLLFFFYSTGKLEKISSIVPALSTPSSANEPQGEEEGAVASSETAPIAVVPFTASSKMYLIGGNSTDKAELAQVKTDNTFSGTGVSVTSLYGQMGPFTVLGTLPGSPAAEMDIVNGDELLAVDGKDTATMDIYKATELMRGPAGTTVTLSFRRPSENRTFSVTIPRRVIALPDAELPSFVQRSDVWSSTNGRTWQKEKADAPNLWEPWDGLGDVQSVTFKGKTYVFGKYMEHIPSAMQWVPESISVWSSSDNVNWSLIKKKAPWSTVPGSEDEHGYSLAYYVYAMPSKMIAVSYLNGYSVGKDTNSQTVWSSTDGATWTKENAKPLQGELQRVVSLNGTVYAVVFMYDGSLALMSSTDGVSWSTKNLGLPKGEGVMSIIVYSGELYLVTQTDVSGNAFYLRLYKDGTLGERKSIQSGSMIAQTMYDRTANMFQIGDRLFMYSGYNISENETPFLISTTNMINWEKILLPGSLRNRYNFTLVAK